MVWDNYFDSNGEICLEIEGGDTIDLIKNGTNIGFNSIATTEHELQLLPHVNLTSKF